MSKTYIIDNTFLEEEYALNIHNSDKIKKINVAIKQAQQRLRPILCDDLYNELLEEFENDTLSYTNTSLLPFCQNYVGALAFKLYVPLSGLIDTDTGFRSFNDEDSGGANSEQLKDLSANLGESQEDFYKAELLNFLHENIEDYPLFEDSKCYKCKGDSKSSYLNISSSGFKKKRYYTNEHRYNYE